MAALTAAWAAGDAVFPVDPRLPLPVRAGLLEAMRVGEAVEEGDALVVATSGSTGDPKGAVLTHEAIDASARATSARLEVDPRTDLWLSCLPLAHVGGLGVVTRALCTGTPLTFDVAHQGATLVSLVRPQLSRMETSRFRAVLLGGGPPPHEVPANVVVTYGMTESGGGVVYDGVPLDGVEVRVDDGGQVWLRGPTLLSCYRDGTDPKDAQGWFPTGDLGALGEDGRLAVQGRAAEVIVTGGEKVFPSVLEDALRAHPAVADVAVTGRPDDEWGRRVVALVVPRGRPPSLEELRACVKERLPAWCAPRELVLVDELPRSALGKLRRAALPESGYE